MSKYARGRRLDYRVDGYNWNPYYGYANTMGRYVGGVLNQLGYGDYAMQYDAGRAFADEASPVLREAASAIGGAAHYVADRFRNYYGLRDQQKLVSPREKLIRGKPFDWRRVPYNRRPRGASHYRRRVYRVP
jgi:hypothetical protein